MDKATAQETFKKEIGSRWEDFAPTGMMYTDWIDFLSKFTPEQVAKAAKQYKTKPCNLAGNRKKNNGLNTFYNATQLIAHTGVMEHLRR